MEQLDRYTGASPLSKYLQSADAAFSSQVPSDLSSNVSKISFQSNVAGPALQSG